VFCQTWRSFMNSACVKAGISFVLLALVCIMDVQIGRLWAQTCSTNCQMAAGWTSNCTSSGSCWCYFVDDAGDDPTTSCLQCIIGLGCDETVYNVTCTQSTTTKIYQLYCTNCGAFCDGTSDATQESAPGIVDFEVANIYNWWSYCPGAPGTEGQ
jgi:hypothetical protein